MPMKQLITVKRLAYWEYFLAQSDKNKLLAVSNLLHIIP